MSGPTRAAPPASSASSLRATCHAASRSSCGRSPTGVAPRPASTGSCAAPQPRTSRAQSKPLRAALDRLEELLRALERGILDARALEQGEGPLHVVLLDRYLAEVL